MRIQTRSAWLAAIAAGILSGTPVCVRCDSSPDLAAPHRSVVFTPDRPDRCDYFFVTEFNVGVTGVKSQDGVDRFLFTDAIGLMRHIDRSRAVGASIDVHLTAGAFRVTPTIRFKQWLTGRRSLDLSLGYASATNEQEGVVGPIVDVRYSPTAWFHVQAGACRIRNVGSIWYYPEYRIEQDSAIQIHAGVGVGGVPGVISWGAQAVGAIAVISALSGMN